ncbi:substrate-binding periplasmic protein [Shewanella sp.]|uniref:substrate-binding periplasmic protein n=1 Tax=Shewanella sp. TaxID=50422 RepID=UPI003563A0B8
MFLLAMCFAIVAQASTVTIGATNNKPPYVLEDSESGLELEIIRAAFAEVGMDVRFKFYSRKRQILFYEKERLDGVMTVNSYFRLSGYPTENYIYYQNVAISLEERGLRLKQIRDLTQYSVAAFENASVMLGGEFKTVTDKTIYRELSPQSTQNKMLYLGRIDVAVADKYIFLANNRLVESEIDSGKKVEFHEIFPRTGYQLMFRNSIIRDAFNEGLNKIKQSGRYQALLIEYLR